jgi:hypothetical protein
MVVAQHSNKVITGGGERMTSVSQIRVGDYWCLSPPSIIEGASEGGGRFMVEAMGACNIVRRRGRHQRW